MKFSLLLSFLSAIVATPTGPYTPHTGILKIGFKDVPSTRSPFSDQNALYLTAVISKLNGQTLIPVIYQYKIATALKPFNLDEMEIHDIEPLLKGDFNRILVVHLKDGYTDIAHGAFTLKDLIYGGSVNLDCFDASYMRAVGTCGEMAIKSFTDEISGLPISQFVEVVRAQAAYTPSEPIPIPQVQRRSAVPPSNADESLLLTDEVLSDDPGNAEDGDDQMKTPRGRNSPSPEFEMEPTPEQNSQESSDTNLGHPVNNEHRVPHTPEERDEMDANLREIMADFDMFRDDADPSLIAVGRYDAQMVN